jgi:arylsulfatase A-like enzyme
MKLLPTLLALALIASPGLAAQPNIIFIMADDLGYTDTGTFGSTYYETPNIDKLATQGLKLTSHHHAQNCQPTRAALMSGQYGPRTGIYTVGGIDRFDWQTRPLRPADNVTSLPLNITILPQPLKAAGYATAMFGKWHLGESGGHHPGDRGFDEALVSDGKHIHFQTNPKTDIPKDAYLADFLTDKAVDFIQRRKDTPFFLYLPHFGVHSPYQAKKELIEKFKAKPGVGGHKDPVYAAMIASVDESVGRIMAKLDELQLSENTVLIFTSDNGGVGGYEREGLMKKGGDVTDNTPLRSGKGSLYEGGTRVPFVVRWPGITQPATTCGVPTIHVDLYPTLVEIAAAQPPPSQPQDGESLVPLFKNPTATLKRDAIFQNFPGYLGAGANTWRTTPVATVISGDWKLMEFMEDKHLELYNLRDDIGEKTNLATTQPDHAKTLLTKLHTWQTEIKAPMPTPNTPKTSPAKGKEKGKNKGKKKAASE